MDLKVEKRCNVNSHLKLLSLCLPYRNGPYPQMGTLFLRELQEIENAMQYDMCYQKSGMFTLALLETHKRDT